MCGQLITERIIPTIARIRHLVSLRFDTLFSRSLLEDINVDSDYILCSDLGQSDRVFGALSMKYVLSS